MDTTRGLSSPAFYYTSKLVKIEHLLHVYPVELQECPALHRSTDSVGKSLW